MRISCGSCSHVDGLGRMVMSCCCLMTEELIRRTNEIEYRGKKVHYLSREELLCLLGYVIEKYVGDGDPNVKQAKNQMGLVRL